MVNRTEALRILGLDEEAGAEDIKNAYKEMAQILHPDRFASSKKLQNRATEQFKNLQEAYELLTSGKESKSRVVGSADASKSYPQREIEARLAGIAAARTQLVAERDAFSDERRNGMIIAGIGLAVVVLLRRMDVAIALGSAGVIWGLFRVVTAQLTLRNLDGHIRKLYEEQSQLEAQLGEL